ncbi:MAG: hypothetical protein GWP50_10650, partial [Proteobacteria bacterium]|nr:hypothetical protein [Pseudomonadota bacterium]
NPAQGRDGMETPWLSWGTQGKHSLILDTPKDQGIFMDDQEVVLDELKQALINDPNITDQQERCNLYRSAFRGATEDVIANEVCSGY